MEDIYPLIFDRLLIKDLLSTALVCKSWYSFSVARLYRTIPPDINPTKSKDTELVLLESIASISIGKFCRSLESNRTNGSLVRSLEFFSDVFVESRNIFQEMSDESDDDYYDDSSTPHDALPTFGLNELKSHAMRILVQCTNLRTLILQDGLIGGICWIDNQLIDSIPKSIEVFELSSEYSRSSDHENFPPLSDRLMITDSSLIRLFERCEISKFVLSVDYESSISPFCILKCLSLVNLRELHLFLTKNWCKETIEVENCEITVLQSIAQNIRNQNRLSTIVFSSNECFDLGNPSTSDLFSSFSNVKNFDYVSNYIAFNDFPKQTKRKALSAMLLTDNNHIGYKPFANMESLYWNESLHSNDLPTITKIFSCSFQTLSRLTLILGTPHLIGKLIKLVALNMEQMQFLNFSLEESASAITIDDIEYYYDALISKCKRLKVLCIPEINLRKQDFTYIADIHTVVITSFNDISNLEVFSCRKIKKLHLLFRREFDYFDLFEVLNDGYFKSLDELKIDMDDYDDYEKFEQFQSGLSKIEFKNFPKVYQIEHPYDSLTLHRNDILNRVEYYERIARSWYGISEMKERSKGLKITQE